MDFDDTPLKKDSPLTEIMREDLSSASLDELAERIQDLQTEIKRVEGIIASKKSSHLAAESVFKT